MPRRIATTTGVLMIAATLASRATEAAPTASSIQVAARLPTFLAPAPAAPTAAAILFRPGDPASTAEAALIERSLAGAPSLRVRRVPVDAAGSLAGVRVVFVTGGLAGSYSVVERLTRAGALTIGSERACAAAAKCVAAVTAGARVEIFVSRAARQASGLKFKSTFLMLVKEL